MVNKKDNMLYKKKKKDIVNFTLVRNFGHKLFMVWRRSEPMNVGIRVDQTQ